MRAKRVRIGLYVAAICCLAAIGSGCGGRHEPGSKKEIKNGTAYYLQDGIFIEELYQGTNYYYLVDRSVIEFELQPGGLEVRVEKDADGRSFSKKGWLIEAQRPPTNFVVTVTRDPDEASFSRFPVDAERMEEILDNLGPVTTVRDIRGR